jgi:hypothetical protein
MNKASVNGSGVNLIRTRSLVDGQGRSISALSGRGATYLPPGLHHNLGAMSHHSINQLAGLGLGGLNMLNPSALGGSMAGLPTGISGLGPLSRAGRTKSFDTTSETIETTSTAANAQTSTTTTCDQTTTLKSTKKKRHNKHKQLSQGCSSSAGISSSTKQLMEDPSIGSSTTALISAEALPASSTETLTSTQA